MLTMETSPNERTTNTSPNGTKPEVKSKKHPFLTYCFFCARVTLVNAVHVCFVVWKEEGKRKLTCICLYMSKV